MSYSVLLLPLVVVGVAYLVVGVAYLGMGVVYRVHHVIQFFVVFQTDFSQCVAAAQGGGRGLPGGGRGLPGGRRGLPGSGRGLPGWGVWLTWCTI